ncbi:MAG: hypothetical protein NVS2B9_16550 [Myxococcales bacterium]
MDHAVSSELSPDGRTLLVLTSGYNRNNGPDGKTIASESNEYVFVYDVSVVPAVQRQVLQVPNTFCGLAFAPDGQRFYVAGGVDDSVHVFALYGGTFREAGAPISLGHKAGLGLGTKPAAAGIGITADGKRAVVANYENDSVSVVDLGASRVLAEVDLRPGKAVPPRTGTPGGEYPFWVSVKGNDKAYVSSQRDGEVDVVDLATLRVESRIKVGQQPNKMILDRAQRRLFVANGNSDTVSVIDTASGRVVEQIATTAPRELFEKEQQLKGSNPNALALSPDERALYVTNGGTNALAVIRLSTSMDDDDDGEEEAEGERGVRTSRTVGLIPTGWYPNAVAVSTDGSRFYVINGKSNSGPNPQACRDQLSIAAGSDARCNAANQYVWQLEKAGFLELPAPAGDALGRLSVQVARNNHFFDGGRAGRDGETMEFLRSRIKHVVYIIKENRTYDQVLGDLGRGNADPKLTIFPQATTPNHHALARTFVTLDNFFDSGETSGVGWNWTVAGRTTDFIEKSQPVNYAGRGLNYDWEGTNRNVNIGYPTVAERIAANPLTPSDPDLLPGTYDFSTAQNAEGATTYLWSNALRSGLSVRNYGVFGDLTRYFLPANNPYFIPYDRNPAASGRQVFFPTDIDLQAVSDLHFRGYDNAFPDFWREKEWEREFEQFEQDGNLPALSMVRLPHDHFGSFGSAIDGVNTPEKQMADNDYAIGLVVEKISRSRFAPDTLIFIVEDDAQDGPDHVDAHRSIGYVVGPYVRRDVVVSRRYNTVNMVRTIEDVLGLAPQGLTDGLTPPMTDVFSREAQPWAYRAQVPAVLRSTNLPLPASSAAAGRPVKTRHDAAWWEVATAQEDFTREDAVNPERFNRILWRGVMGARPFPARRAASAAAR